MFILNQMVKSPSHDLDAIFKALADPLRRQLATQLRAGDQTASQLHARTDVSLVAVMKHLEVLERAEIISSEKQGRARVCRLNPERLRLAETWLAEMRSFWTNALHQLNDHLQEKPS